MKKIILLLLILTFTTLNANAQTMKAKAIDEISTAYPKNIARIVLTNNVVLSGIELKKGYIVYGTLTDVKSPNRGAKEASFQFTLVKYKDLNKTEYEITKEIKTTYSSKHIKFCENFLREADFSFSPMANANMNMYNNDTDITGKTSQNMNSISVKPLSIAESLISNEYKEDIKDELNYKTGLLNDGEDILILPGDKIKFKFPD